MDNLINIELPISTRVILGQIQRFDGYVLIYLKEYCSLDIGTRKQALKKISVYLCHR